MQEIIHAEHIIKSYDRGPQKRNVLDGITTTIREGEFVSIMGPSGAGKSTLLYALSGMEAIDSGSITFCQKELSSYDDDGLAGLRRTRMGFVFQQPALLKNLDILDNIIFPSMRDKKNDAAAVTAKARYLMKKTGIADLEHRDISKVSGGQLQRAGICRALMNDPRILFGDEPTGALNSKSAQEIMDLLSGFNREGTATMLVTHDPKIAARTRRILFLCDGRIVQEKVFPEYSGENLQYKIDAITESMNRIGI